MRIAIFEPVGDGHYLAMGVRSIAREMYRRGWQVSLWTGEKAREQEGVRVLTQEFGDRMPISHMPDLACHHKRMIVDRFGKSVEAASLFGAAYRTIPRAERPDVVFLPALDRLDFATALGRYPFGETPVTGIWNGHNFHLAAMGVQAQPYKFNGLFAWAFRRAIRHPAYGEVLVHDPMLPQWAQDRSVAGAAKLRYAPDFAALSGDWTRQDARASLGIPDNVRVVTIFGMLGGRKGVAEVVSAVAHASVPECVWLLAAGKQRGDTSAILRAGPGARLREQGRLVEIPGYLDDDTESKVFAASDVMWLGYVGFDNSSGVLFQSARAGLPVLACENGLIGWFTRKYEIGLTVNPKDVEATAAALRRLVSDTPFVEKCRLNGLQRTEAHLPEKLANTVCDACKRAVRRGSEAGSVGVP